MTWRCLPGQCQQSAVCPPVASPVVETLQAACSVCAEPVLQASLPRVDIAVSTPPQVDTAHNRQTRLRGDAPAAGRPPPH